MQITQFYLLIPILPLKVLVWKDAFCFFPPINVAVFLDISISIVFLSIIVRAVVRRGMLYYNANYLSFIGKLSWHAVACQLC